jgi:alpha-tubulin suppressor-like RCC1 family protein
VAGLDSGVKQVAAGGGHTCALTVAGTVKCWGSNARYFLGPLIVGQLGDGSQVTYSATPVDVVDLPADIARVTADTWGSCAIAQGGALKCWVAGENRPRNEADLASGVVDVAGAGGIGARFSVGLPPPLFYHHCALTSAGEARCWGDNQYGQLGDGTTGTRFDKAWVVRDLESAVTAVTAGATHSCALLATGRVRCWGSNGAGMLGDGTQTGDPAQIVPDDVETLSSGAAAISAGRFHACVKTASGGAKCWGANRFRGNVALATGAIGDGTYYDG